MLTRLTVSTSRALDVRIEQAAQHATEDGESSLVRIRERTTLTCGLILFLRRPSTWTPSARCFCHSRTTHGAAPRRRARGL
ncbi:hypothetical protein HYPSUDRAFT_34053 [Hypholoma sublateritium FD-334 SS-4]|uniref:Uncharacterized protein n=1 Tax=Hypholoma sublateritium (strain FD-334 SS-4) TaxID=945553 RepID=A0A0D2PJP1_HYPSF|nr:hypothetical protein HYPSUDRAFT_34053 [Hypholoma sublateritium FD-334 SS-4]